MGRAETVIMGAVVAIVLLALLLEEGRAATRPSAEDVTMRVTDTVLSKTVTSSKVRLVLAVGLEGTGHQFGEAPCI